jgi:hypothetical protein
MTRNGGSRASVVSEDQIARETKPSPTYAISYELGLNVESRLMFQFQLQKYSLDT